MRRWLLGAAVILLAAPLVYLANPSPIEGVLSVPEPFDVRQMLADAIGPVQPGVTPQTHEETMAEPETVEVFTEGEIETPDQPEPGVTTSTPHHHPDTTAPTQKDQPSPTEAPAPTQPAPPKVIELTGDVAGTFATHSMLVGKVNLTGDLIIDGATLSAGPGVDVQGNGFQIMIHNGGRVDWRGTPVSTWSGDGSNANLSRDINFRNMRRIMFMGSAAPSVIRYVAVHSSGTSQLGDYPLHWHLNGDSTRGTLVEGVVVVDGRHHAFVPHGSHGITFRDTIAWQVQGAAYWWDPPGSNDCGSKFPKFCTADNSNDTSYDHALAAKVSNGPGDRSGFRLSGFVLGAGSGNAIRDSVAREITPTNVKDCSGFHWPEGANQNEGGNVWSFINNKTAASECHGIFVWQNDGNPHLISGFSGGGIDHGAYGNAYHYRNVTVPYLEVHAIGWQISQSGLGTVTALKHVFPGTVTFTDVTIDSFIINDADGEPATYVLNETNLGCGDINSESAHPDSRVIINGSTC